MEKHIYTGFLEAMYFAEDETGDSIAPHAEVRLRAFIADFVTGNAGALEVLERYGYLPRDIGRLLYFTLAGHGVGFWEHDHYKILQDWVDAYYIERTGRKIYQIEVYIGYDGLTYIDGL